MIYNVTTYSGSASLGNGWYQLSIPVSDFAATIASNDGFLIGPLGDQGAPFTVLFTDIGFSGTAGGGGGAGTGIIPDAVIYATDPGVTVGSCLRQRSTTSVRVQCLTAPMRWMRISIRPSR